jgi:hypothetical protein
MEGYVARMGQMRSTDKILVGKLPKDETISI